MKRSLFILPLLVGASSGMAAAAPAETAAYFHRIPAAAQCPVSGCSATAIKVQSAPPLQEQPNKNALFTISHNELNFGSVPVGTSTSAQVVRLSNLGSDAGRVGSVSLASGAPEFLIQNGCPAVLAPNDFCDIGISFNPGHRGGHFGELLVQANDRALQAVLTGSAVQAAGSLIPVTGTDYGTGLVSQGSSLSFKYVNTGDAPATNTFTAVSAGLQLATRGHTCGRSTQMVTIPVGGSCTVSASYTRPTAGDFSGTISLQSSSENSPSVVPVTGSAVSPMLSFSPSSLDFGPLKTNTTESKTYTIKNVANYAVTNFTLTELIAYESGLWKHTTTCTETLAPGASCSVTVTYAPTVAGPSAVYQLQAKTQIGTQMFSMSGSAVD